MLLGSFRSPALCHVLLSTGSLHPHQEDCREMQSIHGTSVQILKNDLFGMHLPLDSLFPISLYLSTGVEQFGVFLCTLAWPQSALAVTFFWLLECEFVTPSPKMAEGEQTPTGRCAVRVRRQELGVPDRWASSTTCCWLWLCHLPECSHACSSQLTVCTIS